MHAGFVLPHWEIGMGQAPLSRDEQIAFMKDAPKRRAASVERWSKSEMLQDALREPAHRDTQDTQ
ncbi:hypothetical protein AB9K35_04370 [Leisingera sp. XS_AS12]|uniref:hypothetical protein n=1 Tax=Leisingera sp. XS_AS12 TaxID=3241294 RepID=UPI0035130D0A